MVVFFATQLLTVVWAVTLLGDGSSNRREQAAFLVAVQVALWVGYGGGSWWVAHRYGSGIVEAYGARFSRWDVPVGLVLGVVMQLAVVPAIYRFAFGFLDLDPGRQAQEFTNLARGGGDRVLLIFSAGVMAPLVEELFYRGLVLRSVQRWVSPWATLLITSFLFALVHGDWHLVPGLTAFGLVVGYLALRSGRLGGAWACHVGFNATTLVLLLG